MNLCRWRETLLQVTRSNHLPASTVEDSVPSCLCISPTYPSSPLPILLLYQAFVPSRCLKNTPTFCILSSVTLCSQFFLPNFFPWQHSSSARRHVWLVRSSFTFLPWHSASRSKGLYLFFRFLLKVATQKDTNSSEVCTDLKLRQNCSLTKKTFTPSLRY